LNSISLLDALYGQRGISVHNEYQSNCIKECLQLKNKLDWGERGGMFSEGVWGWENWNVTKHEEEDLIAFRERGHFPKNTTHKYEQRISIGVTYSCFY
jgi:hypothetical protein